MSKKKEADPTLVEETEVAPKKGKKKLILAAAGALVLLALVVLSLMLLVGGLMRLVRAFGGDAPAAIQARRQQLPLRRQRTAGAATSYLLQQKS